MNFPLCYKCADSFWAKDVLRQGNSLRFRGCQEDSRIRTYDEAKEHCPLLTKAIDVKTVKVEPTPKKVSGVRLKPTEWCKVFGVEVIDADGWRDRWGLSWDTAITRDMFIPRFMGSTTRVIDRQKYVLWQHLFRH